MQTEKERERKATWRKNNPNYQKEWREKNKETYAAHKREYAQKNRDRYKDQELKRRYGISLEEYRELERKQNGLCAICGTKPKRLFVDHNHKTGKVRGLLCGNCNFGIGYFYENINNLQKSITYLLKGINRNENK